MGTLGHEAPEQTQVDVRQSAHAALHALEVVAVRVGVSEGPVQLRLERVVLRVFGIDDAQGVERLLRLAASGPGFTDHRGHHRPRPGVLVATQLDAVRQRARVAHVAHEQMDHRALRASLVGDVRLHLAQVDLLEGSQGLLGIVLQLELGPREDGGGVFLLERGVDLFEGGLAILGGLDLVQDAGDAACLLGLLDRPEHHAHQQQGRQARQTES